MQYYSRKIHKQCSFSIRWKKLLLIRFIEVTKRNCTTILAHQVSCSASGQLLTVFIVKTLLVGI